MKIVLDTNILLQSLPRKSKTRPIWDAYLNEYFTLIISNSILTEYEEIIAQKSSSFVADNVLSLILEAVNTDFVDIWYEWNAITFDVDDNKFFDAAIAGQADYIVTNDSHFNIAKMLVFPTVIIISPDEFIEIMNRK